MRWIAASTSHEYLNRSKYMGFGLNFYGFFVFAAFWVCLYFVWAFFVNRREKRK